MPAKESIKPKSNCVPDATPYAEEPNRDERKRYTTQLQRRAQAHITAELGGSTVAPDTDRQVTMIVQHAQSTTGARRVSFYRPVSRGRRWHVATMLADGSFYYGLASQETLGWSRLAFEQRRSVVLEAGDHVPEGGPELSQAGLRSYISVPVIADGRSVAALEAVDVQQPGDLDRYSAQLEETVCGIAQSLDEHSKQIAESSRPRDAADHELTADSVVDLVLRQPFEVDETFEVAPNEFAILNYANGDRPLRAVAEQASLSLSQAVSTSLSLIDRGLLRIGKENRRRL